MCIIEKEVGNAKVGGSLLPRNLLNILLVIRFFRAVYNVKDAEFDRQLVMTFVVVSVKVVNAQGFLNVICFLTNEYYHNLT